MTAPPGTHRTDLDSRRAPTSVAVLAVLVAGLIVTPVVLAGSGADLVAAAQAQIRIAGRITDADGAPIEGVRVTIISLERGERIQVVTDDKGNYVRVGLPVTGQYVVRVEKEGYQTLEQGVRISIGVNTVDVTMPSSAPLEAARVAEERRIAINEAYGAGRDAYVAGDFEGAAASMRKAVDNLAGVEGEGVREMAASAYSILGAALVELGDADGAIDALASADELDPENSAIKVTLGRAYALKGEYDRAQEAFERALALNPEDAAARYNIATVLLQAGQVETAIEYFEQAIEIQPEFPLAHKSVGYAYARTGGYANAVEHFRAYLEQEPEAPDRAEIEGFIEALEGQ